MMKAQQLQTTLNDVLMLRPDQLPGLFYTAGNAANRIPKTDGFSVGFYHR